MTEVPPLAEFLRWLNEMPAVFYAAPERQSSSRGRMTSLPACRSHRR
jgi:hypothetical protein